MKAHKGAKTGMQELTLGSINNGRLVIRRATNDAKSATRPSLLVVVIAAGRYRGEILG